MSSGMLHRNGLGLDERTMLIIVEFQPKTVLAAPPAGQAPKKDQAMLRIGHLGIEPLFFFLGKQQATLHKKAKYRAASEPLVLCATRWERNQTLAACDLTML